MKPGSFVERMTAWIVRGELVAFVNGGRGGHVVAYSCEHILHQAEWGLILGVMQT